MKPRIVLKMAGGAKICTPATLTCVTTYVILEQERWFEKEASFVARCLQKGMTAIDIGANLGVYSLEMARAVAPTGRVYAFEPASDTAAFLEKSRDINGFKGLNVIRRALSNTEGEAVLHFNPNGGELSSLNPGSGHVGGETVAISTLDAEARRLAWRAPDFIKIDAEGEELRVIEGGHETFTQGSPLVMFEVIHGDDFEFAPARALRALGYDIYRLLGDSSMLVPWIETEPQLQELNLFAAKPDRAVKLEAQGLLVAEARLPADFPADALDWIAKAPWLAGFAIAPGQIAEPFRTGLAALGQWRDKARPPAERFGALSLAIDKLFAAIEIDPSVGRLATLANAAWDFGDWSLVRDCLARLMEMKTYPSGEPFAPALRRLETVPPGDLHRAWFAGGVMEQHERVSGYSTVFRNTDLSVLNQICANPFASPEMVRRLTLQTVAKRLPIDERLRTRLAGGDHLNADVLVPARLAQLLATSSP